MPGGDGSGPEGKGPGVGRSRGGRGQCRSRGAGGPGGTCICPECGYEVPHRSGLPCVEIECENCGTSMVRK